MRLDRVEQASPFALACTDEFIVPDRAVLFEGSTSFGARVAAFVAPDGGALLLVAEDPVAFASEERAFCDYPDEHAIPSGTFDPAGETIEIRSRPVLRLISRIIARTLNSR